MKTELNGRKRAVHDEKPCETRLPREKIERFGAGKLENWELLAVVLGHGCAGKDVFALARELSDHLSSCAAIPTLDELRAIPGIGRARAAQLLACLEFSRRRLLSVERFAVRDGDDLASLFNDLRGEAQEHFVCVTLNSAHEVIARHEITVGLVNQSPVHPREAFRHAIADNAVAVAFAHNHPGGSAEPSEQDVRATRRLVEAGELLGIHVLDHLVVSRGGWRSALR